MLVLESQNVLELFLEHLVNGIQNSFVLNSQIVLVLLVHRLYFQNDDLVGFLVCGHQHQIFLAFVIQAIQVFEVHILAVLVGEGEDAGLLFGDQVLVFHGFPP